MKLRTLILIVPLVILVACRTCPTKECATLSALPNVPTEIHVSSGATPCVLPPRPQSYQLVGMPSEQGILVTKDDLRSLVVWLQAMDVWASAAALCLESR